LQGGYGLDRVGTADGLRASLREIFHTGRAEVSNFRPSGPGRYVSLQQTVSPLLVTQIFNIIRRINQEQGVAILLVEQNAHMALKTADFCYVLEVGRIVLADQCSKLMQTDAIKEFYLGQKDTGVRGQRRWKRKRMWH
jgi:ABC-type hemin transport system ATPase subunit